MCSRFAVGRLFLFFSFDHLWMQFILDCCKCFAAGSSSDHQLSNNETLNACDVCAARQNCMTVIKLKSSAIKQTIKSFRWIWDWCFVAWKSCACRIKCNYFRKRAIENHNFNSLSIDMLKHKLRANYTREKWKKEKNNKQTHKNQTLLRSLVI